MQERLEIDVEGKQLQITNPEKPLWPEIGLRKIDFIRYLIEVSPYFLAYARDRLLTTIRYPHGVEDGKSFYQKNIPKHAPDWISTHVWRDTRYILVQDLATLIWLGNQACLEFHVSFNTRQRERMPTELVFDLDPSDGDHFERVLEVALNIKKVLDGLGLSSQPKTSGATGLQIYIPIEPIYTYEEMHLLNKFIAQYVAAKYPRQVTLERWIKNRGDKLYFDYLQHGEGRTLPAPYSPRARPLGSVSAPVRWSEIERGFLPENFTMLTMPERLKKQGDLFASITTQRQNESLDEMLGFLRERGM
ncbi:DNA polymerase domain-containing protein [Ammoniphilus oxalaticus]|uniref:DNA polymerase domain-containing protein n=1 Tax=Ammoniphilus oxalaticus TaxID=66863 RepID=A0A419SNC3_9BACL|nr:non-homologous end-joining DNA ligase [Ammoniphilus oxalaticus]RKD25753.1 DNA polymerase domain-containing protein [Ammoniphilus oxalaticus]